jgi:23S rRNA-/tRNA-specific pseudouridylate synthase
MARQEQAVSDHGERLAKVMARAGLCSRREAERRVADGRVSVNGKTEKLPAELPRVVSIGRLDINTEGLLLLTNDGGLARTLELPATGWTRRYRVRVYGRLAPSITRASASIRRAALASLAATAARRKSSAECCLRVIATAISLSPPCESPAQGNHIAAPRGIPRESESKAVGIKWGALRVRHNFVPRVARRL